jgi:hypothetical protein
MKERYAYPDCGGAVGRSVKKRVAGTVGAVGARCPGAHVDPGGKDNGGHGHGNSTTMPNTMHAHGVLILYICDL